MDANPFSLAGQEALVIGGTSGIGLAIAEGFARSGAHVAVAGRDTAKLEAAVAALGKLGATRGCQADVRDMAGLRELIAAMIRDRGRIDTLVNSQRPAATCSSAAAAPSSTSPRSPRSAAGRAARSTPSASRAW